MDQLCPTAQFSLSCLFIPLSLRNDNGVIADQLIERPERVALVLQARGEDVIVMDGLVIDSSFKSD